MMIPKASVTARTSRLAGLITAVRREAAKAEADPFDDGMVAGLAGTADALKAEGAALEALRGRIVQLARQLPR